MSKLIVIKNIDSYKTDIEAVLHRFSYDIAPHDCTNVILRECKFVGAFKIDYCVALDSKGKKISELRLFWLSVTKEAEDNEWKIGSYILEYCVEFARNEGQSFIYLSVNVSNQRATSLYKKYAFSVRKAADNNGEQDLVLCVRQP